MKYLLIVFALLCVTTAMAQTIKQPVPKPTRKNNIAYAELGGICAYYSLNYQRNIPISKNIAVAGGITLGPVYTFRNYWADPKWSPRVGVQAQAIYNSGPHEIGAGPALCWYTYRYPKVGNTDAYYDKGRYAIFGQAGYSYTTKRGLYLGAYFTPIVFDADMLDFMPWGGLRIGYRF